MPSGNLAAFLYLFRSSWINGEVGFNASTGSSTYGSSSYSTSIKPIASSAIASLSAATAATASPTKRTRSVIRTGWSLTRVPTKMSFTSAPVNTACTPANVFALDVSMLTIRPCGIGLRKTFAQRSPSNGRSAAYFVLPVTLPSPSIRGSEMPRFTS